MKHAIRKTAAAVGLAALWAASALAEPVTVGVLTDMSGPNSSHGGKGSVVAAEMAVEEFGGEVLGEKIRVVFADHQSKPDVGSSIARRWYENEGVDAILGLPVSSIALAVQDVSRETKKIAINNESSTARYIEESCSPYSALWTFDSYSLAKGVAGTLVSEGAKKWFMITADYAAGHSVEAELTKFVTAAGGEVVGKVRHPVGTTDYSSFLLQAQASGADIIGLANFSDDTISTLKQANEFGITAGGQRLAVFFMSSSMVHAAGTDVLKGLVFVTSYVWNRNDETRAWSEKFYAKQGAMPSESQASVYSATKHYLKAVAAAGTKDSDKVMEKMRELPVDDQYVHGGILQKNGSHQHDMYLVQIKDKAEQKEPWDYFTILKTVPAAEAYKPVAESVCSLVGKN